LLPIVDGSWLSPRPGSARIEEDAGDLPPQARHGAMNFFVLECGMDRSSAAQKPQINYHLELPARLRSLKAHEEEEVRNLRYGSVNGEI